MNDAFEDLWYGRLHPYETFLGHSEEYAKLIDEGIQMEDALMATLNTEQQKAFVACQDQHGQAESLALFLAFRYGFRLGADLMRPDEARSQKL